MSNVINCMVFSQHFSYDDEQFRKLLETISEVIRFNSGVLGQVSDSKIRFISQPSVKKRRMFSSLSA